MRKLFLIILSAVLMLSMVACGGGGDVDSSTPSGGESTTTTTTGGDTDSTTPSGDASDATGTDPIDPDASTSESGTTTGTGSASATTKPTSKTTTGKTTAQTTKPTVKDEDTTKYPNFGGANIVFATYGKRTGLTGDTQADASEYAMQWAEKKYNAKVTYKVYTSEKMDEAFTAAALAGQFFADVVTANCIGFVGWCQSGMLEETDKYFEGREDPERWNIETGRFQEKHYGIDAYTSSIIWPSFMLVDNTLLKDTGLEHPQELAKRGEWTFDKFREYAKKATNKSKGTFGVASFGMDTILEQGANFEALVKGEKDGKTWYYNGYAHKESGSYDVALKTLNLMQQMKNVDKSVFGEHTGGLQPVLDAEEAFSKGKILFLCSGAARALTVRKAGNKNFSVVTFPTLTAGEKAKYCWVNSYTFTGFPKRTEKALSKASSKNISMDDLAAFWMDAVTTWNSSRGNAFYKEDFKEAIAEYAVNYLNSKNDAQFLYDMGLGMTYKVTYAMSLETGGDVISGLHQPVMLGQKTPAAAIKQTDDNIQSYVDKSWNKR